MGKKPPKLQITVKNHIWNPLDNSKTTGLMFFRQSWRKIIGQIRFLKKMLRPTSDSNVNLLNSMKQLSQLIYIYRRTQDLGLWLFGLMSQKPISHGMATWSPDLYADFAFNRLEPSPPDISGFCMTYKCDIQANLLILAIISCHDCLKNYILPISGGNAGSHLVIVYILLSRRYAFLTLGPIVVIIADFY